MWKAAGRLKATGRCKSGRIPTEAAGCAAVLVLVESKAKAETRAQKKRETHALDCQVLRES
jgi:hypothetical protein